MPEVMNDLTLKQFFPVHVLEHSIDEKLAKEFKDVVTPLTKKYKITLPEKPYKTDYGEPVSILKQASEQSKCIDQVTDKIVELGNVFVEAMGLEVRERYFSAWINSYEGKDHQTMTNHCKNMFDVCGIYCVADAPNSALTIHNPSPFVQGSPVNGEHNYSRAVIPMKTGRVFIFPSWLNYEIPANLDNYWRSNDTLITMVFQMDQSTFLGFNPIENEPRKGLVHQPIKSGSARKQLGEHQKPYAGDTKGKF